jgi:hypothetical protein
MESDVRADDIRKTANNPHPNTVEKSISSYANTLLNVTGTPVSSANPAASSDKIA